MPKMCERQQTGKQEWNPRRLESAEASRCQARIARTDTLLSEQNFFRHVTKP